MDRYVRWWRDGYLSSTGYCFDIGHACREALTAYTSTRNPFAGWTDPRTAGNGSLMRLVPVPMAYRADPAQAVCYAAESSRTTHGAPAAVDACKFYAAMIIGALEGRAKEEFLSPNLYHGPLIPEIRRDCRRFVQAEEPARDCWHRLRSQLAWRPRSGLSIVRTRSKKAGCWPRTSATTPTTAAVFGQLRVRIYGACGIPACGWPSWPCVHTSPKWPIVCSRSLSRSHPLPPNDRHD